MTSLCARDALSARVVASSDEARPSEVVASRKPDLISHVAVMKDGRCLGLVALRDTLGSSSDRIFADLIRDWEESSLKPDTSIEVVGRLMRESGSEALAVIDDAGQFVGAVTRASLLETLLADKSKSLTESNRLRAEIEAGHARLRAILETAVDGVVTIDEHGLIEFFNPAAERIFGYSADEVIGGNVSLLMPPEDARRHDEYIQRYLLTGEAKIIGRGREVVARRGDGTTFPLDLSVADVHLREGHQFTAFVRDISDGKRAEEEIRQLNSELEQRVAQRTARLADANASLRSEIAERERAEQTARESEARYRTLFEQSPDAVVILDPVTTLPIEFNDLAPRMLGYSREEFAKLPIAAYEAAESPREVRAHVETIRREGRDEFETTMRMKHGSILDVLVNVRTVEFDGRKVFHSVLRDITERKRAEERERRHQSELAHVARLSTMGEMATGIAHELNQPLTAIMNYAAVALKNLPHQRREPNGLRSDLEKIAQQAERAGEIIRRVRRFVRKRQTGHSTVDVNQVVRVVAELLVHPIRSDHVTLRLELADNIPSVLADTIQLQQVVLNLMRNAMDAMSGAPANERLLTVRTELLDGATVAVSVIDGGPPLADDDLERFFEPFHTTKPDGMGMGLSISRSIVESFEGKLTAARNAERGTTFRIALPLPHGDPAHAQPK